MKKHILLFALSLVFFGLSAQELQLQDGKALKNGKLFTGVDVTFFDDGTSKKTETNYSKGLKDGIEFYYHENGELKAKEFGKKV